MMDNSETLSDCSESSKNSDFLSSNISSLSDLSCYEGEFLELKHTLDPGKNVWKRELKEIPHGSPLFERSSQHLYSHIQTLEKQNEKYKNELYNLEQKLSLSYNKKIEKLLKQNLQLEESLKSANEHIQRLINIYKNQETSGNISLLEEKNLILEKSNHDLQLEIGKLSSHLIQCNYEKSEIENGYKNLKTEVNDLTLELGAKEKSIANLKDKILEQHIELQKLLQENAKLTHTLGSVSNELQQVRKSEEWYKKELNQLQSEKINTQRVIAEKHKIFLNQEEKIRQLSLEINKWECKYDEIYLTLLKEKNKKVESDLKEVNEGNSSCDIQSITQTYEDSIHELTSEIANIKLSFKHQQYSYDELTKQHSEITSKCLSLENDLKEKKSVIEKLESEQKKLKGDLSLALSREEEHKAKLLHLTNTNVNLQTELMLKTEEKDDIEETVKTIKKQFHVFRNNYERLKEQLNIKGKEILKLQFQRQELLSVNENLKYELAKVNQKDTELNQLRDKISEINKINKDLELKVYNKEKELVVINGQKADLQSKLEELKSKELNVIQTQQNSPEYAVNDQLGKIEQLPKTFENVGQNKRSFGDNLVNLGMDEILKKESCNNNFAEKNIPNYVVNQYVNSIPDSVNGAYIILEYICKLCKLDDYSDLLRVYLNHKSSDSINLLFHKIDKYFETVNTEAVAKNNTITMLKKKIDKLKMCINRIDKLEKKCKLLADKTDENENLLMRLMKEESADEEIKHLRALLEVKIREQKDKQKRYETNCRTLLRKVKEHMRGRNIAEKHNLHLQELYNNLSDEFNTLKLQLHLKESEINEVKCSLENKTRAPGATSDDKQSSHCESCIELELIKKQKEELEHSLTTCECLKETLLREAKQKVDLIDGLRKENQELLIKLSNLDSEYRGSVLKLNVLEEINTELTNKLNDYENRWIETKSIIDNIEAELCQEKENYLKTSMENELLNKQIEKLTDNNTYLMKEIEYINSCLQQKSEEVSELRVIKEQLETVWFERDSNTQNVITALKSQLQIFKNEVDGMKSEKFFLQRLCNDLKVALRVHVEHNKVLKEYITSCISEEKEKWSKAIRTASIFPYPNKYDDSYIERLLLASKAPVEDKPFSDIQDCLDSLRKEISYLQKQIVEKNVS